MKRDLSVERLFPLGDFKNIKFGTVLKDVPDELVGNENVAVLLYLQLALSCDIAYRRYFDTINKIAREKIQDARAYLEEQRAEVMQQLREEIQKVAEEKSKKLEAVEEETK